MAVVPIAHSPVGRTERGGRGADAGTIVARPHAQRCAQMHGSGDGLGPQGRDAVGIGDLGHPIGQQAHRDDLDALGQHEQPLAELPSLLDRPGSGKGSARRGDDAPAEAIDVHVCRRRLVVVEQSGEILAQVIRQQIAEEMVVEERSRHVVARSGSSASDATNAAWSWRLTRSPSKRRPSPLGTVSTPKPRSITSTGPP